MKYELTNGAMSASVSTLGAELVSLKRDGKEYLWQGDPAYWHGQSPLLFPNCGRFWQNLYRHDGTTYELKAHGFARTTEFTVVGRSESEITLGMHSTEETLRVYPFAFFLFVTYRLGTSSIEVEWFVRNEGDEEMHFQIGAHPAFYLPEFDPADHDAVRGYFSFNTDGEQPITWFEPVEKGCVDPAQPRTLRLDGEGMLPITAKTFDCDTYVIESAHISSCTLHDAARRPMLTVGFHMPVLALWAPTAQHPDCPFVAIEPWTGSCDTTGYDGELANRRHIQHLAPAAHFRTAYTITLH